MGHSEKNVMAASYRKRRTSMDTSIDGLCSWISNLGAKKSSEFECLTAKTYALETTQRKNAGTDKRSKAPSMKEVE